MADLLKIPTKAKLKRARIEIILGCMFSGKSTELIRRVSRHAIIGQKVLVINSKTDTRTRGISTHDGREIEAVHLTHLWKLNDEDFTSAQIIAVDEAQFFPDLYNFSLKCENNGKILIIAGLDGDADRKPFGQILECIPLCDSVVKLTAMDCVSKDGTPALFSKRIVERSSQIDVGGADKYIATSRENYFD
jgi:thymidine kinase